MPSVLVFPFSLSISKGSAPFAMNEEEDGFSLVFVIERISKKGLILD